MLSSIKGTADMRDRSEETNRFFVLFFRFIIIIKIERTCAPPVCARQQWMFF